MKNTCKNCKAFIPCDVTCCPNCHRKSSLLVSGAKLSAKILGASAVSLTLMACYGAPPHYMDQRFQNRDQGKTVPPSEQEQPAPDENES